MKELAQVSTPLPHTKQDRANRIQLSLGTFQPYRQEVCRDLCGVTSAKSGIPPNSSHVNTYGSRPNKGNRKRAFRRRLWRYFKRVHGKQKKPVRAQEAWQKREASLAFRCAFKDFRSRVTKDLDPTQKTHKSRGHKLPYNMLLKVGALNVRGLNGENGITKRQLITQTMTAEGLDVLLLTETQVNKGLAQALL